MKNRGLVVADKDMLIASIALANDETLISNSFKHFSKIEGLKLETWLENN